MNSDTRGTDSSWIGSILIDLLLSRFPVCAAGLNTKAFEAVAPMATRKSASFIIGAIDLEA